MELPDRTVHEMRANVECGIANACSSSNARDGSFNYWPGGDHYDQLDLDLCGALHGGGRTKGFHAPPGLKRELVRLPKTRSANMEQARTDRLDPCTRCSSHRHTASTFWRSAGGAGTRLHEPLARSEPTWTQVARWVLAAAYADIGRKDVAEATGEGIWTPPLRRTPKWHTPMEVTYAMRP